jgi:hypothetical protein
MPHTIANRRDAVALFKGEGGVNRMLGVDMNKEGLQTAPSYRRAT